MLGAAASAVLTHTVLALERARVALEAYEACGLLGMLDMLKDVDMSSRVLPRSRAGAGASTGTCPFSAFAFLRATRVRLALMRGGGSGAGSGGGSGAGSGVVTASGSAYSAARLCARAIVRVDCDFTAGVPGRASAAAMAPGGWVAL